MHYIVRLPTDDPAKVLETTNTWCLTAVHGSYDFYVAQVDSNGDRISGFSNSVTRGKSVNVLIWTVIPHSSQNDLFV